MTCWNSATFLLQNVRCHLRKLRANVLRQQEQGRHAGPSLSGPTAVSQPSGSYTGTAAPSAAAAPLAALLRQPMSASGVVAAAAPASASGVVAVAAAKSSAAPAAVAMQLTPTACWDPVVLLGSVLWALDLHHRRGVVVRRLVTELLREVDELQQLVTWQQRGGNDGCHAMPEPLVRRAQQVMELLHSSSRSASVTFGSWGSKLPDNEPHGGVHKGDGGVSGAPPVASPPPPQPLQRDSGRHHSLDACSISGCHFCLYQLRRQRRAAKALDSNDGEPAPPSQRRQLEDQH